MAVIIDSGIFITLERRGGHYQELLAGLPEGEVAAIAAITASELLAGVHRADTETRRAERSGRVEEILSDIPILSFDLDAARVHAGLWAALASSGQMIGPYDALIAATALAYGYDVMTENLREFERIPGLHVRRPHWA